MNLDKFHDKFIRQWNKVAKKMEKQAHLLDKPPAREVQPHNIDQEAIDDIGAILLGSRVAKQPLTELQRKNLSLVASRLCRCTDDEVYIIKRRYYDGWSMEEIAEDRGLHVQSAYKRLKIALSKLGSA